MLLLVLVIVIVLGVLTVYRLPSTVYRIRQIANRNEASPMKRLAAFAIVVLLLGVTAHSAHAQSTIENQKWFVGISAGPTLTNVTGDFVRQSDWEWGLLVGGYIEYAAHKNFSAELGANFVQKGTQLGQTAQGDFGSLRLRYLELPLLLTVQVPLYGEWDFRVFGGGTLGLNLSCQVKGISNVWTGCGSEDVGDAETIEWSVPFGGGFVYNAPFSNSSFIIDVRYVIGMSDVFSGVDLKTRLWEFLARWQFGI